MYILLISIVIGLAVAMLFLNVYFRVRVFKSYKILVQNEVEFNATDVFRIEKMKQEVVPRYPHLEKEILTFAQQLQNSVRMATVLLVLITAFGAILMWFRD